MTATPIDIGRMRAAPPRRAGRFGPPEYTDWLDESMSWKETCYIGDWSFLWQHRITGPDALQLLADVSVNTFDGFQDGQSKHAIHTDRRGKVIHEGIVTKFGDGDYMVHGLGGFWLRYWLERHQYDASIAADDWFLYQVSGPAALAVLEKVSAASALRDTKRMWVTPIEVAGNQVLALRQGMAGEVGFELQGPRELGDAVWDAVLEAGQEFGIRRLGGRVAAINHLEAHFPNFAREYLPAILDGELTDYADWLAETAPTVPLFRHVAGSFEGQGPSDYYRSPIELGWARNIKFDHDFLGRAELEAEMRAPRRVMRTLVWNSEDVIDVFASLFRKGDNFSYMEMPRDLREWMWADRVTVDDGVVGVSTSRGYSYYFREMLSLVVIDTASAEIGTPVTVHWGPPEGPQKAVRATVAPVPYKADRSRGDLHDARGSVVAGPPNSRTSTGG